MFRNAKGLLTSKIRLGRIGLPLWVLALAGVAAVAGQAVGPILTGSITGGAGLSVAQAVMLDAGYATGDNPEATGDDVATIRDDEGTGFTAGMVLQVGQTEYICVFLENHSGNSASAQLHLNVPPGVDVEVEEISDADDDTACEDLDEFTGLGDPLEVDESRLTSDTWALAVGFDAGDPVAPPAPDIEGGDGFRITVEPKDGLVPGYYLIQARIIQTSS